MATNRTFRYLLHGAFAAVAALSVSLPVLARPVLPSEQIDRTEPLPARLQGIDVREHLGDTVPKGASFIDESGKPVKLGDFLDGKHPVILTLNYSNCPMLCSLELNGLVASLKQLDWTAGGEFKIVTVVLDPKETPAQASASKARYVRQYGRDAAAGGWHFLTGEESTIKQVASSVGFSYGFNEKRNEYIHPAAIMVLSPQGRVARYLYGIQYHPKTMRLSLVEAGEGKIGSSIDQLVLYCFHYDAKEGSYAPVAMNIMRVSSGVGATIFGGFLTSFFIAESRKKKKQLHSAANDGSSGSSPS
jgi:protein SCO1/2